MFFKIFNQTISGNRKRNSVVKPEINWPIICRMKARNHHLIRNVIIMHLRHLSNSAYKIKKTAFFIVKQFFFPLVINNLESLP